MPSRKRTKGKARRAQKGAKGDPLTRLEALPNVRDGTGYSMEKCHQLLSQVAGDARFMNLVASCQSKLHDHGHNVPPQGEIMYSFLVCFEHDLFKSVSDRCKSGTRGSGTALNASSGPACEACRHTFQRLHAKGFSEVWNTTENRKKLLPGLLCLGMHYALGSLTSGHKLGVESQVMSTSIAMTIMLLAGNETWPAIDPRASLLLGCLLDGDTERETIRFFAKRANCSCLKEKYSLMKQERGRRTGCCFRCRKGKEVRELFVCTGCQAIHFCSKKCPNDFETRCFSLVAPQARR